MKKFIFLAIFSITLVNVSNARTPFVKNDLVTTIDDYKKIKSSELPAPVVESILKEYPTSKLRQAYKNRQNKYKLIMVLSSGTARTVYIDAYGRWFNTK